MNLRVFAGLLMCLVTLFNTNGVRGNSSNKCPDDAKDPQDLQDRLQRYRASGIDETFFLHPRLKSATLAEGHPVLRQYFKPQKTLIYGNRRCPTEDNYTEKELLNTSACPWYLELNYNPNRYPKYMMNARCRCRHCLTSTNHTCTPVTSLVKVLRRDCIVAGDVCTDKCKNGEYIYKPEWEEVHVGCTCDRKLRKKTVKLDTEKAEQR